MSSIVIVVPERWLRVLLRTALTDRGHDVVSLSSLAELVALKRDRRHGSPDLIIIDQHAAGGNGARLLESARRRFGAVPFVLLAGWGPEIVSGPWTAVIPRPSTKDDIVSQLESVLGAERASAAAASA